MTSMQIDGNVRDELAAVAASDFDGVPLGEAVRRLLRERTFSFQLVDHHRQRVRKALILHHRTRLRPQDRLAVVRHPLTSSTVAEFPQGERPPIATWTRQLPV